VGRKITLPRSATGNVGTLPNYLDWPSRIFTFAPNQLRLMLDVFATIR